MFVGKLPVRFGSAVSPESTELTGTFPDASEWLRASTRCHRALAQLDALSGLSERLMGGVGQRRIVGAPAWADASLLVVVSTFVAVCAASSH
jgi:hypothetical protein